MKQRRSLSNHQQCPWCEGPIGLAPTWPPGSGLWSGGKALGKPGSSPEAGPGIVGSKPGHRPMYKQCKK